MRSLAFALSLAAVTTSVGCSSSSTADASDTAGAALSDPKAAAHSLHCQNGGNEVTFAATADSLTLTLVEEAYKGHTEGILLKPELAPDFFAHSTGHEIRVVVTIAKDGAPNCGFSKTAADILACNPYAFDAKPVISDGVTSATIDDALVLFETERRVSTTVNYERDELAIELRFGGHAHPLAYKVVGTFPRSGCEAQ